MANVDEKAFEVSIGLANLPSQIHRAKVISGFDLNVMVTGECGVGKSTFFNMLFEADVYVKKKFSEFSSHYSDSLDIKSSFLNFNEKGFNVRLEVVDVQGFGRSTPMDSCWDAVGEYLTKRLDACIDYETKVDRDRNFRDTKIHFCLYFISPNTKRLSPRDIHALRVLCDKVSVIPLIGKSDSLLPTELSSLKNRIVEDLMVNKINIFKFQPQSGSEKLSSANSKKISPDDIFAVIGSDKLMSIKDKKCYCRSYPWGSVAVDDEKHSDVLRLKNLLILSNLHAVMKNADKIFERYRTITLCKEKGVEFDALNMLSSVRNSAESVAAPTPRDLALENKYDEAVQKYKKELQLLEDELALGLKEKERELESLRESIEKKTISVDTTSTKENDADSKKKKDKKKKEKSVTMSKKLHKIGEKETKSTAKTLSIVKSISFRSKN